MKRQLDKFHSEIGMMKESINDTRDSMESLEEKMDMILGLLLKNGSIDQPLSPDAGTREGESPADSPLSHSRSSPALHGTASTRPLGGGSSLGAAPSSPLAGRKVQLAPLTSDGT